MNKLLLAKNFLLLLIGNLIASFGVAFCAASNLGVDPLTVLYYGVCNITNLDIGFSSFLTNITLLIICVFLNKKSVKIGTIISIFIFPVFLELSIGFVINFNFLSQGIYSWLSLLLGILMMGIGFSTCIHAKVGPSCIDVILEILMSKSKKSIRFCKITLDFFQVIIGVMLGGTFGIGTILCVLLVGFVYNANLKYLNQIKLPLKYHCNQE